MEGNKKLKTFNKRKAAFLAMSLFVGSCTMTEMNNLWTALQTETSIEQQKTANKITVEAKIPKRFEHMVLASAERHGVDPEFIAAVIQQESRWRPRAISGKDCKGLMQLKQCTAEDMAKRLGIKEFDIWDPATNIELGTKYIAYLKQRPYIGDDPIKILTAYNHGMGNVQKLAIAKIEIATKFNNKTLNKETRGYLTSILERDYLVSQGFEL